MAGRLSLLGAGRQTAIPAGVVGWWNLNGTITSCIAAYQPKGAASYAASKVNLVDSGTYALTDGSSYPTWATETGWVCTSNSAMSTHLVTTLTPTSTWTVIIRIASCTKSLFGTISDDGKSYSIETNFAYDRWYQATANATPYTQTNTGVLALAGVYGYLNGTLQVTIEDNQSVNYQYPFFIGCANNKGSMQLNAGATGNIYAIAFYNATLSATQIANLTAAMNAL